MLSPTTFSTLLNSIDEERCSARSSSESWIPSGRIVFCGGEHVGRISGVMKSTRRLMADHRVLTGRAAFMRRSTLSLEKECSIGSEPGRK